MLENRLSGSRVSSDAEPTPRTPAVQSSTSRSRSPNPPYPNYRSASQQNYYEGGPSAGSALPRPSLNMSREPSSDNRSYAAMNVPPSNSTSRSGSSSRKGGSGQSSGKGGSAQGEYKRTRTHSTPYPFDRDDLGNTNSNGERKTPSTNTNGIPTPASSRANSPLVGIGPSASSRMPSTPNDRPSKIPMRKRQRSNSHAASSSSKAAAAAASGYAKKKSAGAETVHQAVMFPPSPETSPELWLERDRPSESLDSRRGGRPMKQSGDPSTRLHIPGGVDEITREPAPFNPNRASRTSFEEREFEHWYRGEGRDGGGRNGGRGEIKMAKADTTKEMLEIAVGGHVIPGKDRWAARRRYMEPEEFPARHRMPDPDMDYVMDEPALTDLEGDAYATDYGQELDTYPQYTHDPEVTGEDLDDYYYTATGGDETITEASQAALHQQLQSNQRRSTSMDVRSPSQLSSRAPSRASLTPSHHSNAPPSKLRQPSQPSKSRRPSTTTPQQPRKSSAGNTARSKTPDTRARTQSKARQRVASRSAASSGGDRPSAMADAIPSFASSPPPPKDGNWDDVVLPTVAKKMALTQSAEADISMLGSSPDLVKQRDAERKRVYEPAPGTFAYDSSKTRSPPSKGLNEFGGPRLTNSQDGGRRSDQSSSRPVSPPPFASYMADLAQQPPEPMPKQAREPQQTLAPPNESEVKRKPSIVVTSPSDIGAPGRTIKPDIDDEGAGCCKCVIM